MRKVPLIFFAWILTSIAGAESVVDVSKEWNAHVSSSSTIGTPSLIPAPAATPIESTATLNCSCEILTPKEYLEQSTYAFTGIVSETSKPKKGKRTVLFEVQEIFKGSPKGDMKVTAEVTGTDCDFSFEPGQSYLVFAQWEWGAVKTSRCMGTKYLEKAKVEALGPSEALKEKLYIRLRNGCMGRYDTPCCLSSLKAMRANYYVPQPEEGCPEGTIPDRLRCGGSFTWCIPVTEKSHQ